MRVKGDLSFTQIASGTDSHACAIDTGGRAWCWGANALGELGNGSTVGATVPTVTSPY